MTEWDSIPTPKNVWDGVSIFSYCWRKLVVGVYATDDGSGTIFSGATANEILVPGVQDGVGGGVADSPLSDPSRETAAPEIGDTTVHTGTQVI